MLQDVGERADEKGVDRARKMVAGEERDHEGADRPDQPPPQLDKVVEQRHRLVLDRVFGLGLRIRFGHGGPDAEKRKSAPSKAGLPVEDRVTLGGTKDGPPGIVSAADGGMKAGALILPSDKIDSLTPRRRVTTQAGSRGPRRPVSRSSLPHTSRLPPLPQRSHRRVRHHTSRLWRVRGDRVTEGGAQRAVRVDRALDRGP